MSTTASCADKLLLKGKASFLSRVRRATGAFAELCKPRVVFMVLIVTTLGFVMAGGSLFGDFALLFATLAGTALSAAGSAALNQCLEIDSDKLMNRTKNRPLPSKRLPPDVALFFGVTLILAGVSILAQWANLLAGFLALLTAFLYVLVYTPLKKVTWLNTLIGAVPGALPPVGGWVAVSGSLDAGAWILFLILFIWQQPHFYAIAWMYRDDYAKGGYKMLPVLDPEGVQTFYQIVIFSHLLIVASLLPLWHGLTGVVYLVGAVIAGIYFLSCGIKLSRTASIADARQLLKASLIYLPILFVSVVIDIYI